MKLSEFKDAIQPFVSVLMANFDYEAVKVFKPGCFCFALVPNCDTAFISDYVILLLSQVPSSISVIIETHSNRPCIVFLRSMC